MDLNNQDTGDTLVPQPHQAATNSAYAIAPAPTRHIAGFWRRFFAFFIDTTILAVAIGFIAGPFFDALADLGPAGRLVGFLIGVFYFAFPESSLGHGATIGKRFLRLQVVNAEGKTLSLEESLVRYTVFAVPWFLNGVLLPISRVPLVVSVLLGIVIFGVGGTNLYLLIFNRNTRQGLHDLSMKSYVVMADETGPVLVTPIWKKHWAIAGSLFVVLGIVSGVVAVRVAKMEPFPQFFADLRGIEAMDRVEQAGVNESWVRNLDAGTTTVTTLNISVWLRGSQDGQEALADQIATWVLQNDPNAGKVDTLNIGIYRGYDLGIAHASKSQTFRDSPAKWHERLFGD